MREWWRGGLIYQIYPRSFQDSDGNGIGDLPGIIRRLDHVASLGVDAVWLSPFFQSPMEDMGYDVSDYKEVDPVFGSLADFDSLVRRAHDLGLKVVIDQVLSHTSDRHPWFQESRLSRKNKRADWYVWVDPKPDGSPPNNWVSVFGGRAWEWNPSRGQYYLHNFLTSQPDLNFHNPAVQKAILDVMHFWLERGVDGFRFDTVNYYFHDQQLRSNPAARRPDHLPYAVNPYDMQIHKYSKNRPENLAFLKRMRTLMNRYPGTMTVGEVGESHRAIEIMAEYTAGGDKLHMCYSFEFLGDEFSAEHFRGRLKKYFAGAPDGWPCWTFSNHDVKRHVTRWARHAADPVGLGRQSAALLMSLRGTVCLYQGEELGLPEADILFEELTDPPGIRFWPEYKGRDGCRTPMPWEAGEAPNGFSTVKPWLPVKPPHSRLSVEDQERDPESMLNFYRRFIAFRKANPALIDGRIDFVATDEPVLAFRRTGVAQSLLCVFNLSARRVRTTLDHIGSPAEGPVFAGNAALKGTRLDLEANGFAFFAGSADSRAGVQFKRRTKS